MTKEFFPFIDNVEPKKVFVAATVDQGGNVVNACKSLGLPTLLCRAHRINSCVLWALGIAGSPRKCKNAAMKKLIGKAAALVGVFTHSAVNNDALRAIQEELSEKEKNDLESLQYEADELEAQNEGSDAECDERDDSNDSETQDPGSNEEGPETNEEDSVRNGRKPLDVLNLVRRNDTR